MISIRGMTLNFKAISLIKVILQIQIVTIPFNVYWTLETYKQK